MSCKTPSTSLTPHLTPHQTQRRVLCGAMLAASLAPSLVRAANLDSAWSAWPRVPEASLLDHNGKPVKFMRDLVEGRAFVMNFIFTSCTTVCPPQTALLKQARARVVANAGELCWLSVSVDPLNDTPASLKQYRQKFSLDDAAAPWHFLTCDARDGRQLNELAALRAAWGEGSTNPNDHLGWLIIGSAKRRQWLRMDALAAPDMILRRVREVL